MKGHSQANLNPTAPSAAAGAALLCVAEGSRRADQGEYADALRWLRRSLEIDLDCREAWAALSGVFLNLRDRDRASACLEVAYELRRKTVTATA